MKRYIKYGLIGFLPSLLLFGLVVFIIESIVINQWNEYGNYWIGKEFTGGKFYNSNGDSEVLDFTSTEYTVIDFWFAGCAPCIVEMREFDKVLKIDSTKLKIYSVSVDKFSFWKALTAESPKNKPEQFKFLSYSDPNWIHLSIFHNDSSDSSSEILDRLHIDTYPTYLVINQKGYVVDVKHSLISSSSTEFKVNEIRIIKFFGDFFKSGSKNIIKVIRAFSLLYVALYTFGFLLYKGINKLKSQLFAQKRN